PEVKTIILCGIEAHVCVQGTALQALEDGYDVHIVVDGCSSRSMVDRMFAFERMKAAGAWLTTSESVILGLVGDASSPHFKECQKLIMQSAPDSGLLSLFSQKPQTSTVVTNVNVFEAKVILLGLEGVVAPNELDNQLFIPYIRQNGFNFLKQNRNNDSVVNLIPALRQLSYLEHYRNGYPECPVILDEDDSEDQVLASVHKFIVWQMDFKRESNECHTIQRMVTEEGLNGKHIKVNVYED
ncbi:unnamed protein product, partial [Oppiella nova]